LEAQDHERDWNYEPDDAAVPKRCHNWVDVFPNLSAVTCFIRKLRLRWNGPAMPALSFFIDEHDLRLLVDRLNADPEIAYIVSDDAVGHEDRNLPPGVRVHRVPGGNLELEIEQPRVQRWKAVRTVDTLADGMHSLWHIPAGPLPLIDINPDPRPLIGPEGPGYPPIPDAWAGWIGPPGFGSGCHPWIRLEVWTRHQPYTRQERKVLRRLNAFWLNNADMLVVSNLEWTGSHFRPAPPQTQRWWNRMKGWVDRKAVRLNTHANVSFWAFPSAFRKLKDGMQYYSRNFDLDDAIRGAKNPQST